MARKVGASGIRAQVVQTILVKLEDISLASDSGWRDVAPDMVNRLKEKLMAGEWGQTTLGNPSIVCELGQPMTASDGKLCINNGKHIITALVELNSLLEKAGLLAEHEEGAMDVPIGFAWFVPPLREVFTQGVRMDYVQYPVGTGRSTHAAVQCLAHEAEMNQFQESTAIDKAKTARRIYSEVGTWDKTRATLLEILGSTKRNTVTRWITIARDVDEDVLSYIKQHKTLPQKYFYENKYLVGTGQDKRTRLKPENAIAALSLIFEKMNKASRLPQRLSSSANSASR